MRIVAHGKDEEEPCRGGVGAVGRAQGRQGASADAHSGTTSRERPKSSPSAVVHGGEKEWKNYLNMPELSRILKT